MSKQTKQMMAVAAGVLALVGLQSISVPTRPVSATTPSYVDGDASLAAAGERSRQRPHRQSARADRDAWRVRTPAASSASLSP